MLLKDKLIDKIINHPLVQHLCTEGEKDVTLYSYGNTYNSITGGYSFITARNAICNIEKDHVYLWGLSISGDGSSGYGYFRTNDLIDVSEYSTLEVTMKPRITHGYAYTCIGVTNNPAAYMVTDSTTHYQRIDDNLETAKTYTYDISAFTGKRYIFVGIAQGYCSYQPAEAWIYEIKLKR